MTKAEEDALVEAMYMACDGDDREAMRAALRVARRAVLVEAMQVSMAVAFAEETGQRFVSAATGSDVGYANHVTHLLERLSGETTE